MSRFALHQKVQCGSPLRSIGTPFTKSNTFISRTNTYIKKSTIFSRPTFKLIPFNRHLLGFSTSLTLASYTASNTRSFHVSQTVQQKVSSSFGVSPDFGSPKLSTNPNWKKYSKDERKVTLELSKELAEDFHELKKVGDELIDEAHGNIVQLFESGEYQLCIEAADRFIEETDPYSVDALQYKAMSLNKLEKFDAATEVFEQAKLYVDMYELSDKGQHLDHKGDYDSAILCYDRVLEVMPKVAEVWMYKANALSAIGKHEEAVEAIEEASELDPEDVMILWSRATIYQVAGEYDEAIMCLNDVLERYPKKHEIHYCKGFCFSKMGKDEEAIRCFDLVLESNPRDADALFNKAISLQALGQYEEALNTFKIIKEGSKTSPEVEYNEGVCHSALGNFEQAIARYDAAIRLKPDFTDAYYNKGTAHLYLEQPDKAIKCYDKVIALQDQKAHEAYYNKGVVLYSFDQMEAALENFTAAVQGEHRVAAYHYCRGMCLTKLGKQTEAAESIAIATKLNPNVVQELQGVFE